MSGKDWIAGAGIVCIVAILFFVSCIGSYETAKSIVSADQYLTEQGFTFEKKGWWDVCGSWSPPTKIWLRYPEFIETAKQNSITTIYKEYSESGRDFDYWFYAEKTDYRLFEKWYPPQPKG